MAPCLDPRYTTLQADTTSSRFYAHPSWQHGSHQGTQPHKLRVKQTPTTTRMQSCTDQMYATARLFRSSMQTTCKPYDCTTTTTTPQVDNSRYANRAPIAPSYPSFAQAHPSGTKTASGRPRHAIQLHPYMPDTPRPRAPYPFPGAEHGFLQLHHPEGLHVSINQQHVKVPCYLATIFFRLLPTRRRLRCGAIIGFQRGNCLTRAKIAHW